MTILGRFVAGIGLVVGLTVPSAAAVEEGLLLKEVANVGQVTSVKIGLRAEGTFRPSVLPGQAELKAESRLIESEYRFYERVLAVEPDGWPTRAARWTDHAGVTIRGEARPHSETVRPEVALLVASRRDGRSFVSSPSGPLSRFELDLVEAPGDPMGWSDLLPNRRVRVGDTWEVGPIAARSLSGYDSLAVNFLRGKLESMDQRRASIRIEGEVRGAWLGAEGTVKHKGTITFDRSTSQILKLDLERGEVRKPGAVEDGLNVKSTLTVSMSPCPLPKELGDKVTANLAGNPHPDWDLLVYHDPGGSFVFDYERDWHIYWDDSRKAVLKRMDGGDVSAQLNLIVGGRLNKGEQPDPARFRAEIRRGLGSRFVKILDEGELVDLGAGNGRMLRVMVEGRHQDAKLIWIYYFMVGPRGEQLVGMFTLHEAFIKEFADQDLRIMGSIRWTPMPAIGSNE